MKKVIGLKKTAAIFLASAIAVTSIAVPVVAGEAAVSESSEEQSEGESAEGESADDESAEGESAEGESAEGESGDSSAVPAVIEGGYDYPARELYYDTSYFGGALNYKAIVEMGGGPGFDVTKFIDSKLGEDTLECMKGSFMYMGYDDPATFEMWAEKGITKVIGEISNEAIQVPMAYSAFIPADKTDEEVMPVVIVFHGGGRNILDAEFYGFSEICARERLIAICPQYQQAMTDNPELSYKEIGESLLNELESLGYTIDRNRVYAGGHSAGGLASVSLAVEDPQMLAAIAPIGSSNLTFKDFEGIAEEEQCIIPMYMMMGEFDYGQLPMVLPPVEGAQADWVPENLIAGLNKWLAMDGCANLLDYEKCLETMEAGDNEVCNFLGIYGDENYTIETNGTEDFIADFLNGDGEVVVRFEGAQGLPHFMHPEYAEHAWEFMKNFSTD